MTEITRGEFELLKDMVNRDALRTESIDNHGTRGVAVIQEQVTELIKDVVALKIDNANWQAAHTDEHKQDKRDRVSGRRWLVGIGVAGIGALGGLYGFLALILQHLHH